jgi:hypothetical protein
VKGEMGKMGKGEMGTAHAGKPPSLPRELRTPLVYICFVIVLNQQAQKNLKAENRLGERAKIHSSLINPVDTGIISEEGKFKFTQ